MADLYKGIAGSPITYLTSDITANQTTISIADDSALPDAPNICTIGYGENLETIKYETKSNGVLQNVTRGIEGTPRAWPAGTEVARFFTAYDHNAIIDDFVAHKADMTTQLALKSDKAHGGWVNITLQNGWTGTLQVTRLDNGLCILSGQIVPGTIAGLTTIATIPNGYRSTYGIHVTAYLANGDKFEGLLLNDVGSLRVFRNPTLTEGATIRFTLVYLRGGI